MLKYAFLLFLIILPSIANACMAGGSPEDEVSKDAIEKDLATLSKGDIVFIGVVVGVIPQERPAYADKYAPLSFQAPIFKAVKPIQNSTEGDLYEGRTESYTCSGSSPPKVGELWLFHATDSKIKETWLRTPERNVTSKEEELIKSRFDFDLVNADVSTFVAPDTLIKFAKENNRAVPAFVVLRLGPIVLGLGIIVGAAFWLQRTLRRRAEKI